MVWAYDANALLAVKQGQKQPWEVKPYATWPLTLPFGSPTIGGAAYDAITGTIYVSQQMALTDPVIHVFQSCSIPKFHSVSSALWNTIWKTIGSTVCHPLPDAFPSCSTGALVTGSAQMFRRCRTRSVVCRADPGGRRYIIDSARASDHRQSCYRDAGHSIAIEKHAACSFSHAGS
jgi:hypothetical protein